MIPKFNANVDVRIIESPSKTYRIDFAQKRIVGTVDGLQAMAQAVEKICRTERYSERIYSGNYGIELNRLIGASMPFVEANIEMTFDSAFAADSRITGIDNVTMSKTSCDEMTASCRVHTTSGDIEAAFTVGG